MLVSTATAGENEYAQENFIATLATPALLSDFATGAAAETAYNHRLTNGSFILDWTADTSVAYSIINVGQQADHTAASLETGYPTDWSLTREPPIGCCAIEEWNRRTFMRTTAKIMKEMKRICEY